MSDLESSLAAWRSAALLQETITPAIADELEAHLRDQITELTAVGLSEDEAFTIALRRLGQPESLAPEFSVAAPGSAWQRRIFWGILGYLEISLALVFITLLGRAGLWIGVAAGSGEALPWVVLAAQMGSFLVVAAILAASWHFAAKGFFPGVAQIYTRRPGRIAAVIAGAIVVLTGAVSWGDAFSVHSADPAVVGQAMMVSSYAAFGTHLLAFAGLTVALVIVGRVFRRPATLVSSG